MLLEVILSVLIIGSVLMLVARSYSASLAACQVAGGLSKACGLLEEKLFDLDMKGFADGLARENDSGAFKDEPGCRYDVSVNPLDDVKRIGRLDLRAAWKGHAINVSTYLKLKEG
jgi:hypothetical protein